MHLVPAHVRHLQAGRDEARAAARKHAEAAHPARAVRLERRTRPQAAAARVERARYRGIRGYALVSALEQQLQPQADAQKGRALSARDLLDDRGGLAAFRHMGDGVGKRPHAGQHDAVRVREGGGVVRDLDRGARAGKPAGDAREVALVVVDHDDLGRSRHGHPLPSARIPGPRTAGGGRVSRSSPARPPRRTQRAGRNRALS